MIILHDGEVLETVLDIACRLGRGHLYITTAHVLIEIAGRGLVFCRQHAQMADITETKKKNSTEIRLVWPEAPAASAKAPHDSRIYQRCDVTCTVSALDGSPITNAAEVIQHLRRFHDYRDNYPNITGSGGSRNAIEMGPDMRRRQIRERLRRTQGKIDVLRLRLNSERKRQMHTRRNIISNVRVINHIRREIAWRVKYMEDVRNIKFLISRRIARHPQIPVQYIETNDCWFDTEYGCYCTLSAIWHESDYHKVDHNWLEKKYGAVLAKDITVIPAAHVVYQYGYPAEMQQNPSDGTLMYAFLPTMTDDMLTDEIVSRSYGLAKHTNAEDTGSGIKRAGRIIVEPVQPDFTYDTPMGRRLDTENEFLHAARYDDAYGGDYLMGILDGLEMPAREEERFVRWCDANGIEYLRS